MLLSSCSPHREGCGMVQIHSPGHSIEYDPHAAIREIRRSLSRSPSKTAELRQHAFRSSPANSSIPFNPSPLSPSRRSASDNLLHVSNLASPNAGRLNQSSRVQRPTLRRSAQGFSVMRIRTSPKSPSKRALTDLYDHGNATPGLRKRSSSEVEVNCVLTAHSPSEDKENSNQQSSDIMTWKAVQTRQEKRRSGGFLTDIPPLSPMKRTSEPMNIDQPDFGSPSTKRRSLHTSSGLDFSIFDSDSLQGGFEKRAQDDNDWCRTSSPHSSSRFSTIPKRSSSLRKSTLQQRQPERLHPGRLSQLLSATASWTDGSPGADGKKSTRLSLDNHLPDMQRDSPFSAQGNLLSASIHPVASSQSTNTQPRHPLSRTLTQSSSTPSTQDNSPIREPMHRPERPKSHDFSKSLPVGALRPVEGMNGGDSSSQSPFATPATYKSARPLPAAFMSTGLISKKNRNAEDVDGGLPKAHMPDTPCKRQSVIFDSAKKFRPAHSTIKHRPSFGTPSTPADTPFVFSRAGAFPFGKSTSLFGPRSSKPNLMRKASFASIESEDKLISQSPPNRGDSQSTDTDYPPTPTKHANVEVHHSDPEPPVCSSTGPSLLIPTSTQASRFSNCKLPPIQASPDSKQGEGDSVMEDPPSTALEPKSLLKVLAMPSSSFAQNRALRNLNSPTPLARRALVPPALCSPALRRTKTISHSPVSPLLESNELFGPHTPSENVYPPDPSGLSISGRGERPVTRNGHMPFVPATPTGPREYFGNFSNRPSLNLNASDIADVDRSLATKFNKAELVGTGEFSQVYRVSLPLESSPFSNTFGSSSRSSGTRSTSDRVWAVKKSRYPYSGPKDRQRKVHEVDVLKVLNSGEHVLHFVDSWEDRGHLYIQTEFCEEGTLDVFLAQAGLKARLDDFRIWKILLELSLGLKHVHDNGFIHLDLKPANILITFDGTLRIGDFGMASKWPAKSGIEGEGDREYIGPEILMGQYDKPADIFALGLIMLETAGNVELPDNGVSWQKLRQGDMSDVPSLTFSSDSSSVLRDASGNPISEEEHELISGLEGSNDESSQLSRRGEMTQPPPFMTNPDHKDALDQIVRWMISPSPQDRPVVQQVLEAYGVHFAELRRRAGATIFEGNWGPADEVIAEDAEMIDV